MKKWHLWLAVSIGLVVIVGMMIREFDVEVLSRIDLSPRFFLGVVMGVLLFAVQNLMLTRYEGTTLRSACVISNVYATQQ